jgi:hypothetical protein
VFLRLEENKQRMTKRTTKWNQLCYGGVIHPKSLWE